MATPKKFSASKKFTAAGSKSGSVKAAARSAKQKSASHAFHQSGGQASQSGGTGSTDTIPD